MSDQNDEGVGSVQSVQTTTSRVLHRGPCKVYDVMVAGDGAAADCQVYDGVSDNDELKAWIEAVSGTTFHWDPPRSVNFHQGLYVKVNTNTTHVTVTFASWSAKKSL